MSRVAARHRPPWRWLLVGLLGVFTLGVTAVYVATVTMDVRQHHWAGTLDASRAAVPAAVGWAALLIVFFARTAAVADKAPASEDHDVAGEDHEVTRQAALVRDSARRAEQRVQRLAAKLAELSALAAQDRQNRQLARQIGETAARLDLAMQWLVGACAALAASQPDVTIATGTPPSQPRQVRGPRPPRSRRVALPPVPAMSGAPSAQEARRQHRRRAVRTGRVRGT